MTHGSVEYLIILFTLNEDCFFFRNQRFRSSRTRSTGKFLTTPNPSPSSTMMSGSSASLRLRRQSSSRQHLAVCIICQYSSGLSMMLCSLVRQIGLNSSLSAHRIRLRLPLVSNFSRQTALYESSWSLERDRWLYYSISHIILPMLLWKSSMRVLRSRSLEPMFFLRTITQNLRKILENSVLSSFEVKMGCIFLRIVTFFFFLAFIALLSSSSTQYQYCRLFTKSRNLSNVSSSQQFITSYLSYYFTTAVCWWGWLGILVLPAWGTGEGFVYLDSGAEGLIFMNLSLMPSIMFISSKWWGSESASLSTRLMSASMDPANSSGMKSNCSTSLGSLSNMVSCLFCFFGDLSPPLLVFKPVGICMGSWPILIIITAVGEDGCQFEIKWGRGYNNIFKQIQTDVQTHFERAGGNPSSLLQKVVRLFGLPQRDV